MKNNIEILSEIFEPTSFDCKTEKEDLQIAITLNPDLIKILRAMELAQEQVKLCNIPHVSPRLFYVVAQSHTEEGNWEQISNGFEDYSKAKQYRDGSFCKGRWPHAFIVASLNEG